MSDDALKFKVDLVGNMVAELVAGGKAANTAEGGVQALTGAILQLTEASKKKEKGFFTFDLAEGASMALGLVQSLASEVWDLGKAIVHAAAETQDLGVALRANVGEAGAGQIEGIAKSYGDTRFGSHRIEQSLLPLLNVGMGNDPAQLKNIVTAATDVAARTNNEDAIGEVLDTFKRIHTRREVNARMLTGIGVNEKDFYAALGETLNRSAADAEAQVKAGKVKAETLEAELLGQIAKREGGKLGAATDASAKTLGTTIARLERIPASIFNEMANSPGLKLLQDRADQFIETMSISGKDRIAAALGDALNKVATDLLGDGKSADDLIQTFVTGIPRAVEVVKTLGGALASALGFVSDLITALGKLPKAGESYGDAVFDADEKIKGWFNEFNPFANGQGRFVPHYQLTPDMAGGLPQAHDFLWRNGEAIQLDPADTVVGAKGSRGDYLDSVMGGGGTSSSAITLAPVLQFHLSGGGVTEQVQEAAQIARVEVMRIMDEARARFGAQR